MFTFTNTVYSDGILPIIPQKTGSDERSAYLESLPAENPPQTPALDCLQFSQEQTHTAFTYQRT